MAREKMNKERERLEQRLTKRDWFAYLFGCVPARFVRIKLMLGIHAPTIKEIAISVGSFDDIPHPLMAHYLWSE